MMGLILIFVAVAAGSAGAFFLIDQRLRRVDRDNIQSRLLGTASRKGKPSAEQAALIKSDEGPRGSLVFTLLRRFELRSRLQRMLEKAGLRWPVTRLANLSLAGLLAGCGLIWYGVPAPLNRLALPVGLALGALPVVYVVRKGGSRLRKFEEQFPEGLEFVSRSMRAGHAFSVSLEMLHQEFDEPLAGEFRRTFDEQNLGLPLEVALEKLAQRMPLLDVQFFVSAVLLQKRTGGNLAEVLDKLAYLIRERFKLRGRIRAISAHGRMTGTVLSAIPAGVAAIMFYVNPDYVLFFVNDTTGHWMIGGAIALQMAGYAAIRKIVAIEI